MIGKTIEIEIADGSKLKVSLQRILRKDRRLLNKLVMPKEVSTGDNVEGKIEFEKLEEYREKLVSLAVSDPVHLKDIAQLQELPDSSFNELFAAANEVNPTPTDNAKTEKK